LAYSSYLTLYRTQWLNNQVPISHLTENPAKSGIQTPLMTKHSDKDHSESLGKKVAETPEDNNKLGRPVTEEKVAGSLSANERATVIGRIIALDNLQMEKLTNYYNGDKSESLRDILGKELAEIYFKEVQEAYANSFREQIEYDVFYLSRKYGLSPEQEYNLTASISEINNKVRNTVSEIKPRSELENAKLKAKLEQELKEQEFQKIFDQNQFSQFLKDSKESTNNNILLFH